MILDTPLLETPRLVLRPPRMSDAETIFQSYGQDAEVCRYVTWRPHQTVADTQEYLRRCLDDAGKGTRFVWAITPRGSDTLVGMIETRLAGHKAECGYVLAREHWGRGVMSEALRAVADFALSLPGVYRVWAVCDVENRASARVMEKAGMAYEGTLRRFIRHGNVADEPRDALCYARTR